MFVSYGGNISAQASRSRDGPLSTVQGILKYTQPCLVRKCNAVHGNDGNVVRGFRWLETRLLPPHQIYSASLEFTVTATKTQHGSTCRLPLCTNQTSVKFDDASITSTKLQHLQRV